MNNNKIQFKYADSMSNWEWRPQSCLVYADTEYQARQKCKELYGLGIDCEYEITRVTKM